MVCHRVCSDYNPTFHGQHHDLDEYLEVMRTESIVVGEPDLKTGEIFIGVSLTTQGYYTSPCHVSVDGMMQCRSMDMCDPTGHGDRI